MSAVVQNYSQSQARLMFVTTLGMDNFYRTKMNAHFKKITACLWEGLIHEWKQALLAPYVAKQLMALFHTPLFSSFGCCCIGNDILRILVKAQPSTRSTWPQSPTWLGIRSRDLGLLNKYSLGHSGLSAASRHKVAFTRSHYALKAVSPR